MLYALYRPSGFGYATVSKSVALARSNEPIVGYGIGPTGAIRTTRGILAASVLAIAPPLTAPVAGPLLVPMIQPHLNVPIQPRLNVPIQPRANIPMRTHAIGQFGIGGKTASPGGRDHHDREVTNHSNQSSVDEVSDQVNTGNGGAVSGGGSTSSGGGSTSISSSAGGSKQISRQNCVITNGHHTCH
jgi:hypothetical protein